MAAPGTSNNLGISSLASRNMTFESPAAKEGGSRFDMGMLALFLVSNWFVNGETVLIDGGVSQFPMDSRHILLSEPSRLCFATHPLTSDRLMNNCVFSAQTTQIFNIWSNDASGYIYLESHNLNMGCWKPPKAHTWRPHLTQTVSLSRLKNRVECSKIRAKWRRITYKKHNNPQGNSAWRNDQKNRARSHSESAVLWPREFLLPRVLYCIHVPRPHIVVCLYTIHERWLDCLRNSWKVHVHWPVWLDGLISPEGGDVLWPCSGFLTSESSCDSVEVPLKGVGAPGQFWSSPFKSPCASSTSAIFVDDLGTEAIGFFVSCLLK